VGHLTGQTLYRIKTAALTDKKLSKSDLESKVEAVTTAANNHG
jgi:hypothetical protein